MIEIIHRHHWGWRRYMESTYQDNAGAPLFATPDPLWAVQFMAEEAGELVGAAGSRLQNKFLRARDNADSEIQELCDYIMMASTALGLKDLPKEVPPPDEYSPQRLYYLTAHLLMQPDDYTLCMRCLVTGVAGLVAISEGKAFSCFTNRLTYRERMVQEKERSLLEAVGQIVEDVESDGQKKKKGKPRQKLAVHKR